MSNETLRAEWRDRLDDFSDSEMTVAEWCRFNAVPIHQFYYWRHKLSAGATLSKPRATGWMSVSVVDTKQVIARPSGVSVRIGSAVIDVAAGFDSGVLRAVVAALGAASC